MTNDLKIAGLAPRSTRLSLGEAIGKVWHRVEASELTLRAPELRVLQRCEPVGSFLSTPSAWLPPHKNTGTRLISQRAQTCTPEPRHQVGNTAHAFAYWRQRAAGGPSHKWRRFGGPALTDSCRNMSAALDQLPMYTWTHTTAHIKNKLLTSKTQRVNEEPVLMLGNNSDWLVAVNAAQRGWRGKWLITTNERRKSRRWLNRRKAGRHIKQIKEERHRGRWMRAAKDKNKSARRENKEQNNNDGTQEAGKWTWETLKVWETKQNRSQREPDSTSRVFLHACCFVAVTHRLYSAPRNKFSGFLHTLHSAEGRQKEHNASDECQGQRCHWASSAHFKGLDCAFCHLACSSLTGTLISLSARPSSCTSFHCGVWMNRWRWDTGLNCMNNKTFLQCTSERCRADLLHWYQMWDRGCSY